MSAVFPDGYKQVGSLPYESFNINTHTVTYKKINDKCEIVRTKDHKEYQSRISPIPNTPYIMSNGPFENATLTRHTESDYEGDREGPVSLPDQVVLEDETMLEQTYSQDCRCLSFYYAVGANPEKQSKTKVTFAFLKGKCMSTSITQEFAGTQTVNDIKIFIRGKECVPEVGQNIILVWDKEAQKLENEDQLISTLGETADITVNFVKNKSQGGSRNSHRRHKSNKNKRTRRKSVKRLHRRKLY